MKYLFGIEKVAGTAIPVSSLRSSESGGVGEFSDLVLLGRWCKSAGLNIIQILPVNDTGWNNSPYSAISANALHPLFIRLQHLPGADSFSKEIASLQKKNEKPSVDYNDILKSKLKILTGIYKKNPEITGEMKNWLKKNPWCSDYALFKNLRKREKLKNWRDWSQYSDYSAVPEKEKESKELEFHIWTQYFLAKQLSEAAESLNSMGIALKGDLPILMSEDSCDVWRYPELFNHDMSAGAPPDFYSYEGQNWGFPTYNWKNHEKQDFSWWKLRIKTASRFYHAYRIDHVLGFFRIWSIPRKYHSARMGHFNPFPMITRKDLESLNYSKERITWFSQPHFPGGELRERMAEKDYNTIISKVFDRIGNEDLYLLKEIYSDDNALIKEIPEGPAREALQEMRKNVALIPINDGNFFPSWTYRDSRAYQSLNGEEKRELDELIQNKYQKAEKLWAKEAEKLLSALTEDADMLVCAEDLGAVPSCVAPTLKKLNILSLKVIPWARDYEKPGEPFTSFGKYPEGSVCTTSVHDSETFRQWLLQNEKNEEIGHLFGFSKKVAFTEKTNYSKILKKTAKSKSRVLILPLQDILLIDKEKYCQKKAEDERINIPGTVSDRNWSWRMMPCIEDLLSDKDLMTAVEVTLHR